MTQQRSAIVTGAASGIGRASASRLVRDGWLVVGIDVDAGMPDGVTAVVGDAANADMIRAAVEAAGTALDALVCSAGVPPSGTWDDPARWHEIVRVDLTGPYEALRLCLPALASRRGAAVVVGSIIGSAEGSARSPAYAAAKAGLVGLVRSMALIGARDGVRVNLVEPGAIDTDFDPPLFPPDDRPDVPMGRMGTAEEVAGAICYLLGPDSTYVTGTVLRVDGGRTITAPGGLPPTPGASSAVQPASGESSPE